MREQMFTVIDNGNPVEVPASIADGKVRLSRESMKSALGWELKPEGLCRGAVCVPLPQEASLVDREGIDLIELAKLLDRPIALDLDERAAYVGASAHERGRALASLEAPDFTLPDLDGKLHSLSEHRGKKLLLVAYASW